MKSLRHHNALRGSGLPPWPPSGAGVACDTCGNELVGFHDRYWNSCRDLYTKVFCENSQCHTEGEVLEKALSAEDKEELDDKIIALRKEWGMPHRRNEQGSWV